MYTYIGYLAQTYFILYFPKREFVNFIETNMRGKNVSLYVLLKIIYLFIII